MAHVERRFRMLSVHNSACAENWSKRYKKRLQFARLYIEIFQQEENNCSLLMTDEAHFVNKQNFKYWRVKNSRILNEKELQAQRVTV